LTDALCRRLAVALICFGILLRFLYLGADPSYSDWIGYITDEGRWTAHARGFALFGRTFDVGWPLHLLLAPLYQLSIYLIFSLSSVSVATARLLSAIAGSTLLVSFWMLMRRVVSPAALLVALTLLALEMDVLVLSRLAIPEIVVMAVQLIVYALIVATPGSPGPLALAGFLEAVAVGMKATGLPTFAIFLVVVLARPAKSYGTVKSLAAFGAGFAGPFIGSALGWSLCCYPRGIDHAMLRTVWGFVQPSSVYGAVDFFFQDSLAPTLNAWAVALWLGIVGWTSSDEDAPQLRRFLRTAAVWCATYSSMMLGLLYFPNRYKIHVFVPMAIVIAAGLTLFERVGLAGVDRALALDRGLAGALRVGLIALPTAVFWAPLVMAGVGPATGPPHLRHQLTSVAAAFLPIAWILNTRRHRRQSNIFFVTFPLIAVVAWLALRRTSFPGLPFWPSLALSTFTGWWAAFLVAATALTILTNRGLRRASHSGENRLLTMGAVACIALSIVNVAPNYVDPHYSIREASRGLGQLLSGYGGVVSTFKGEGLFSENRLRYVSIVSERAWQVNRPDVVVTVFDFRDSASQGVLERDYCLIARYPLYVSPECFRSSPEPDSGSGGVTARVYRRGDGPCPRGIP
jgi:hypothetical protein